MPGLGLAPGRVLWGWNLGPAAFLLASEDVELNLDSEPDFGVRHN